MPPDKQTKIQKFAKSLKVQALQKRRLLSARALAAFAGLCQSVYLAVPSARLYLRSLHNALRSKLNWNSNVRLSHQ